MSLVRVVIAFLGGVFPVALGYLLAPSPKYDPGFWGPCGLDSAFPVTKPHVHAPYCLDCYECVYTTPRIVYSIVVLGGLFALSGVFAARIARTKSIAGSVAPVAASVGFLLVSMAADRCPEVLVWPTLLMGTTIWLSALALAALGAFLATRDA